MQLYQALRSTVAVLNLIIAAGTVLSAPLLGVGVGLATALIQPCCTVWALLQERPSNASTIVACMFNGLTLLAGLLIAVVGMLVGAGKEGGASFFTIFMWVLGVGLPVVNIITVVLWYRATHPNNSFKPNLLRSANHMAD